MPVQRSKLSTTGAAGTAPHAASDRHDQQPQPQRRQFAGALPLAFRDLEVYHSAMQATPKKGAL
jgi:hypothetical protein